MKVILLLLFLFSFPCFSVTTIRAKIEAVDLGQYEDPHLLLLENGLVLFLSTTEHELFKSITTGFMASHLFEFEIDKAQNVPSLRSLKVNFPLEKNLSSSPSIAYSPSLLPNIEMAYKIFQSMRDNYKEDGGQCYNMAHVWAYEENKRIALRSMKLFMFFTLKYIRAYHFPWWFHVTPTVYVKDLNKSSRVILDRRYTTYPMPLKEWTDQFIKTKVNCKEVKKMSENSMGSDVEDCFLIETPMYYWQPRDIRLRDTEGKIKNDFYRSEVDFALSEAFKSKSSINFSDVLWINSD